MLFELEADYPSQWAPLGALDAAEFTYLEPPGDSLSGSCADT